MFKLLLSASMTHLLVISKLSYYVGLKMDLMPMSMRMMLTLDLEIFKKGVLSQEELSLEMKSLGQLTPQVSLLTPQRINHSSG